MAPSNGTPRGGMSMRLANMKFMQRAAASNPSTPSTPAEPAAKKRRLSNGSVKSTPASTPRSDSEKAVDPDDARREELFAREAAARGDTKWYLSFQEPQSSAAPSPLRIVSAGYGALDSTAARDHSSEDDDEDPRLPTVAGRRNFGNFGKKEKPREHDSDSESSSGSDSSENEDDGSDDPSGVNALIAAERKQAGDKARAGRKAKKAAERSDSMRMADERRKKEVNLNNVTSISGFGGGGAAKSKNLEGRECYKCGRKGHEQRNCPEARRGPPRRSY